MPGVSTYRAVQICGATSLLNTEGFDAGRKRVSTLMRRMNILALYLTEKTSTPGAGSAHKVYPNLLRNMVIERPNQVLATDITYIPMARGFVCFTNPPLVALKGAGQVLHLSASPIFLGRFFTCQKLSSTPA